MSETKLDLVPKFDIVSDVLSYAFRRRFECHLRYRFRHLNFQ